MPDIGRAWAVYWTVERDIAGGCTFPEAIRRIMREPGRERTRGSAEYQYRQGRKADAEARAAWGALYPTLRRETLSKTES